MSEISLSARLPEVFILSVRSEGEQALFVRYRKQQFCLLLQKIELGDDDLAFPLPRFVYLLPL